MNKKLPEKRWMSLWRHFYHREKTEEQLTDSMIQWQEKWNWDFIKVNPPACYHALDWGAECEFFDDETREPEQRSAVVSGETDVSRISQLDVHSGMLGTQLRVLKNLRSHFGNDLPIVETVFSPIEIAHRVMTGREAFLSLLQKSPEAVHQLLGTITKTFLHFCFHCLDAGANGIFFATKWATSDLLSWEQYQEFGKQYEMQILNELQKREALIILHVCGDRTYLDQMLDYPADIFSYDFFADGTVPPAKVVEKTGKFVLGGVDPVRLVTNSDSVVRDCKELSKIEKWLAGPSCVITHEATDEAIQKIRAQCVG
jgi:uroporphyrinogen decarboxylase